jgi:hypothetical protein
MTKVDPKTIYSEVFNEVKLHPQIQRLERGLLYKIIQIILEEEQFPSQEKTRKVCNQFGIETNACREEDNNKVFEILEGIQITSIEEIPIIKFIEEMPIIKEIPGITFILDFFKSMTPRSQPLFINEEERMEWFVVAACVIIGAFFGRQCLKSTQQEGVQRQKADATKSPSLSPPPIPAALCLIIPARMASVLQIGSCLCASDVEDLIDQASYFLCTEAGTTQFYEQRLELTDEEILPDSQREVYIRFNFSNGQDLIDQKTRYALKVHLPANANFVIKKRACLKSLSKVEAFNRI